MLGNVYDWCHDGLRTYARTGAVDPVGPLDTGAYRVFWGGSWRVTAQDVRTAYRNWALLSVCHVLPGFRCASSGVHA
jgi:formylglycine-generating enzyme required for sulfatase activity